MTDSQGKLLWKGRYDAWGQLIHDSNRHAQRSTHQPFRLQNQYFDQETGLHYNFLRYYEPTLGRFITQDPIGLMGGMNLYRFEGTVQNQVDPLGLNSDWHCFMGVTPDLVERGIAQTKSLEIKSQADAASEYTIGVQTPVPVPIINSNTGLIITKSKNQKPKVCTIFVGCGGASIGKSKIKTGIEGIFSNSATNEGISTSICSTGTLAYRGGITGSRCRGQDGSITYSAGPVLGEGIQYSEQACVQETSCF